MGLSMSVSERMEYAQNRKVRSATQDKNMRVIDIEDNPEEK